MCYVLTVCSLEQGLSLSFLIWMLQNTMKSLSSVNVNCHGTTNNTDTAWCYKATQHGAMRKTWDQFQCTGHVAESVCRWFGIPFLWTCSMENPIPALYASVKCTVVPIHPEKIGFYLAGSSWMAQDSKRSHSAAFDCWQIFQLFGFGHFKAVDLLLMKTEFL